MTMSNLECIASYIWLGANFFYSEVEGASGGVDTFWNPSAGKGSFMYIVLKTILLLNIGKMTRSRLLLMCMPQTQDTEEFFYGRSCLSFSLIKSTFCMGDFNSP
jgi:hypothetical protein